MITFATYKFKYINIKNYINNEKNNNPIHISTLLLDMSNLMAQKKKSLCGNVKYAIKYEGDIDPQDLAKLQQKSVISLPETTQK